jgi:steroid delta-isomerase-like uncharacterized protein
MSSDNERSLLDRYFSELLNKIDFEHADEILSPEFLFHGPSTSEGLNTEGFRKFLLETRSAFSNKRFMELDRIVQDGRAAIRFRMTGTHDGALHGLPPLGGTIDVEGCDLIYMERGRITKVHAYFDLMGIAQRLLTPAPVLAIGELLGRLWPH